MLLYEHPGSPYAQKIKIALREKGVAFDVEIPDGMATGRTDGPLVAANPRAEVPVLVDGETRIFESTIIMEYIEDRWPDPPLLPRSPEARAAARITEDVCDTQYEAVNWGFCEVLWFRRATGELAETLRAEAARQTVVLQDWLASRLGDSPWFGGTTFGYADAAVAPMVNRSVHYGMGPPPGQPPCQVARAPAGTALRRRLPSPSLKRQRRAWRTPWRRSPPAPNCGNTATTGWSGW